MQYKLTSDLKQVSLSDWDAFISKHPKGTVFQSYSMYSLFLKTKKFTPVVIAATSKGQMKGVLLAVIIKEYTSAIGFFTSRAVIYGGPLIESSEENQEKLLDLLLKELIVQVGKRSIFIQFRNFFDWGNLKETFSNNGFKYLERLNYLVDTTSETEIRKRMSSSKLRQVKKALKAGVEIIQPESIDQMNEFYDILYSLYKYKIKKPLPDRSFFEGFYELSKKGKLGVVLLIRYNNKIIGGIVSPVLNDKVIYEWYICGLDHEFKDAYPSVLATWAAIEYANKNGIGIFDFMGVGVPHRDYGVREFKKKFGGDMVNHGRYGRVNNKFLYGITEVGYNLLSSLKKI